MSDIDKKYLTRAFFRLLNRYIVVPAYKLGLARLISNPLTGRIMVLKTIGRKTGKIRYVPVNYAQINDRIYCYQGRHLKGIWYQNVKANQKVEVILPDNRLTGIAEEVCDTKERTKALRLILQGSGLGRSIYDFDPNVASDYDIQKKTEGIPVIRIRQI